MLDLRSAKEDDAEKLVDFLTHVNGRDYKPLAEMYVRAMFTDYFRRPHFVIALDGTDIIGAAAYSEELFTVNTWGISWVSVNEQSRHKGLGKMLVEECLRQIKRKILTTVTIILATHPNKTGLYDKLGFKAIGTDHEGGQIMTFTLRKLLH